MKLFPAIDLFGGQVVRLYRGDYEQMTVYDLDPLHTARQLEEAGVSHLHLIDLEGARSGHTTNLPTIVRIAIETGLFLEVGGGIRSMETIETYLNAGADRVILGTAAVKKPEFAAEAVKAFGDRIAVGVDIKDGKVAIHGWTETSDYTCDAFCERMQQAGVQTVICTDISKDGAMEGTNRELYRHLVERFSMNILASGGISSLEDLEALKEAGVHGAIIGKAYYSGAIDLREAVKLEGTMP